MAFVGKGQAIDDFFGIDGEAVFIQVERAVAFGAVAGVVIGIWTPSNSRAKCCGENQSLRLWVKVLTELSA
jgi:hypothetical protein